MKKAKEQQALQNRLNKRKQKGNPFPASENCVVKDIRLEE
jgi:hypothetical protein